jgi:predicted aldo/keto reductase-like oxidoreductase
MRYKIFGQHTGLKVSELVLGTGMFGKAWGYGAEPDEVRRILQGYVDAGGNLIDTATTTNTANPNGRSASSSRPTGTTSSLPRSLAAVRLAIRH